MNIASQESVLSATVQMWFSTAFLVMVASVLIFLWVGRDVQRKDHHIMLHLVELSERVQCANALNELQAVADELERIRKANSALSWDCHYYITIISREIKTKTAAIEQLNDIH